MGAAAPSSGVTMLRAPARPECCGRAAWRHARRARPPGLGPRPGTRARRCASRAARPVRPAAPGRWSGRARTCRPGAGSVAAGCRRPPRTHWLVPGAGARPRRPAPGGWPPGGLLAGGLVAGLGVGDGGQAGQVHGRQRGPDDQGAGASGHGRPPLGQLALCGRSAGWSAATSSHRGASCHQPRPLRRRRRRGGRASPISPHGRPAGGVR